METWREGAHAGHTHEPNEVTIQLDGIGRQLSELLPEPTAPDGSDGPVFVDESGRRGKTLRRLGWVLAAVFVCYAVTLVVAVLGGNSSAPFLPLSNQEQQDPGPVGNDGGSTPAGAATASVPAADPGAPDAGDDSTAPDAGLPAGESPAPAQEQEGAD
ncbi:hypothetical protein [Streptomyces sp. NPDC019224]|uniref:hypothetical protein n=1 Tax=Streptomyces sp. NPDC019224 TaxID=3154484 RepID=UPI0033FA550A